jgi:isopentenyl-diphosphate Delta-isomerase
VLVKEVGFGMDAADVALLRDAGVAAIDIAGAGGTNWALVEGQRDPRAGRLAAAFAAWGRPTAEAVRDAVGAASGLPVLASGGVRDGVDAARCPALGARAAGMARPLLLAAREGRADAALETVIEQLRIATWLAGAARSADLGAAHLQEPTAG